MIKKWEHDRKTQGLYSRHTAEFPNITKLTVRFLDQSWYIRVCSELVGIVVFVDR